MSSFEVEITRPGKVLFPKDGITKLDLVHYYQRIAPRMLPYLIGRPLVLQRFPDGIARDGFIQKAAGPYSPAWVRKVTVKKAGGTVKHMVCDDLDTLLYLVNQACITFHTWLSRADRLDHPDQMVIDLDPSSEDDLPAVTGGALALKEILDELGMPAFVRATGSRGVHVVVPLDAHQDFDAVRSFARDLAGILIDRDPARYTMEAYKAKRRGRVYIDVHRNGYAQSSVAPYSVRARNHAPVCVPIAWSDLRKKSFRPDAITIRTLFDHIDREDPWKHFWDHPASRPPPAAWSQ